MVADRRPAGRVARDRRRIGAGGRLTARVSAGNCFAARIADMRTAVIRIKVDPARELTPELLSERTDAFAGQAPRHGMEVFERPSDPRREMQVLMIGSDGAALQSAVTKLCVETFLTSPEPGPVTFISRGTDDDVRGVLAGFGISGDISRADSDDGFDVVTVRIAANDLARIPESRIHTALEASLNCEVNIVEV
ncbi:hypothetical protein [Nocardia aurantia]|nr:hypothetical protein [Nocardia aurantia]